MEDMQTTEPRFQIQHLYIKDSSCKVPHAPAIFKEEWKPVISLELQIKQQMLESHHYEVVLQVIATTKVNERTACTIEIHQAGIFKCEGFAEQQLLQVLNAYCPSLLYPYLCRAVSDAAVQAGFPPLLLTPINFEALYQQQQAQAAVDSTNSIPSVKPAIFTESEERATHSH